MPDDLPPDPDAPEIEEAITITVVRADGTVEHIQGDITTVEHADAVTKVVQQNKDAG